MGFCVLCSLSFLHNRLACESLKIGRQTQTVAARRRIKLKAAEPKDPEGLTSSTKADPRGELRRTMRLLNTTSLKFAEFCEPDIPPYAILSHRWEAEEVTYQDVANRLNLDKAGWTKVRKFCSLCLARLLDDQSFEWVWIDTCCI